MGDFPDPDEEYELMYADELELIRDSEDTTESNTVKKKPLPAKRSLDFSSPIAKKPLLTKSKTVDIPSSFEGLSSLPLSQLTDDSAPVTSSKRTVDDLFGDIGDIEDDALMPSKKQKTEEEDDNDLINRIIEGRKMRQLLLEPSNRIQSSEPNYNAKENISINIPRWNFMPLTKSDGERVYVRLESEESWEQSLDFAAEQMSLHATFASTWAEARKLLEEKQQQELSVESQAVQVVETDENDNLMWVDRFRPQSYLDLLSEEPVNRALLHWLHLWDKVVFKKEVKTKEPQQRTAFSKRAGQFQLTNKWKGKKDNEPEMDEDGRPHHKVALLCGPPGVGKTTLAHLLAKLAGYRPVELNASDERSTDAFRTALHNATLMRSVLDPDRRPNCLILDEIDGAPLPTVELLVRWCTATTETGKKKAKTQPLRRPVIAICNNLYATSLRPLRPVSLMLPVRSVSLARLAARLAAAARAGGCDVTPRVCAAVAARAHPDVRAALHLLSFLRKAKGGEALTLTDVEKASVGTKDCQKSLMEGLQAVFTINDKEPNVLRTVQAAGEYDRLADGIFENYLQARVDSRLLIACETLSWLRLYDTIHSWTMRSQNYSLYGALPLCIARCHNVLASRTPQRLKFPTQAQEVFRRQSEVESIVTSLSRGCAAGACVSRCALRLQLLPLLPYLLAPALRSANVQLCSENERKALRVCAGAMCDYGLQYVQQRTPEGLYAFVLEPDIYRIAFFGSEERVRPPPPIRQAIAREQQLEIIRRNEEMANKVSGRPVDPNKPKRDAVKEPAPKDKETQLPNHMQRLQPKVLTKAAPQVHKDFFGRIVPLSQVQRSDAVPDVISSSSVFYQYREGFNNAVRRNVKTKEML